MNNRKLKQGHTTLRHSSDKELGSLNSSKQSSLIMEAKQADTEHSLASWALLDLY